MPDFLPLPTELKPHKVLVKIAALAEARSMQNSLPHTAAIETLGAFSPCSVSFNERFGESFDNSSGGPIVLHTEAVGASAAWELHFN